VPLQTEQFTVGNVTNTTLVLRLPPGAGVFRRHFHNFNISPGFVGATITPFPSG